MTKKEQSVHHEKVVAERYGGIRSKSSGASILDLYDVKTENLYIECKTTGEPGSVKKSRLTKLLEKQRDAAFETGRNAALNMRYFDPESPLADKEGYVYLAVILMDDHIELLDNQCSCNGGCSCQ